MSRQKPKRNKKMHSIPRDLYDQHQASLIKPASAPAPMNVPPESSSPKAIHSAPPAPTSGRLVSAIRRHPGRTVAVVGGTAAVGAGSAVLIHRHNNQQKAAAMSKNWINPFEEVVVFGKAYPVKDVTNVRFTGALVHTGRGVGHGQRLTDVKNSKGGGGKATRLERYTGHHARQNVGPFSKSFGGLTKTGFTHGENFLGSVLEGQKGAVATKKGTQLRQVQRGLNQVKSMSSPNLVRRGQTPAYAGGPKLRQLADNSGNIRKNGNIPSGARRGTSL